MKYFRVVLFVAVFFMMAGFVVKEKPKPFAVVELFTSEGCSSCPSADELLKEMTEILQKEGKEVLSLSFHVTYWNKYGWEDPYSKEVYTDRQKKYVATLKSETLYTPQAIVNGKKEFVGSSPISFRDIVTEVLADSPSYEIQAQAKKENNQVTINYELNKEPKNILLNIVVVENSIVHKVLKGENQNRVLKHYNVVRSLETIEPKQKDQITIQWPEDLAKEKGSIIVYAQNPKSLKITGATKLIVE